MFELIAYVVSRFLYLEFMLSVIKKIIPCYASEKMIAFNMPFNLRRIGLPLFQKLGFKSTLCSFYVIQTRSLTKCVY